MHREVEAILLYYYIPCAEPGCVSEKATKRGALSMQAQPAEARNWALLLGCQDHQAGRLQQALITVVDKGQRAEGQGRKNRTKGAHRPDTEAKAQNAGFNLGDHKTRPSNSALLLY